MAAAGTTIVTQTAVAPEHVEAFADWQRETSRVVSGFKGFLRQTMIAPSPPKQVDWVILQHFTDRQSALDWLRSDARREQLADIQSMLIGHDDVHLVEGDGAGTIQAPVSAVISTRVKPGMETDFRRWEQRVALAQARAPGFQGYRLEPPIAGVQEDWLAIVKFDGDDNLQAWLNGPERAALLRESTPFTDEFHLRVAQTGFDQWFDVTGSRTNPIPAWKQNMLVLLMLYPVVFLFGYFVQTPWLVGRFGVAFAMALFVGNVVSTILLNYLVPWISRRLMWWLQPADGSSGVAGIALVLALYGIMITAFVWLF